VLKDNVLRTRLAYRGRKVLFNRSSGLEPLDADGTRQRDIRPVVQGDRPLDPLPLGGSAIQTGQREIDAGFIHKLQAPEIERGRPVLVGGTGLCNPRRVPFGGLKGLFFAAGPGAGGRGT
jgi:hypothetical protein